MKKIEIETFLQFQMVSNPTFSPNGRFIAFAVTTAGKAENTYKSNLFLYNLEKRQVRQLTSGGDGKTYTWTGCPHGENTLLFSAARNPEAEKNAKEGVDITYFYEISPDGGEAREAFSVPYKVTAVKALPDGRLLLTAAYDNLKDIRKKSYEIIDELPFWGNGMGFTNGKRNRYILFDRKTGKTAPVADEWTGCTACSVYGDLMLYKAYPWKQSVRGMDGGIYLYHLNTGETETILSPGAMHTGAIEIISEKEALVAAIPPGHKNTTKYCEFYKLNLEDKSLAHYLSYDASIGSGSASSDARYGSGRGQKAMDGDFYFLSTVDDYARLFRLDKNGTMSESLTKGSSCDSFDINEEHLVTCEFQGLKLAELYLDGEQITHFNDWILKDCSVSVPNPLTFTASDGYEIHGWVMKPTEYVEGQTYPAILNIHGGPRTAFSDVFYHEMQVWANAGYFVFFCNPRGSDGRGTDFGNVSGIYGTVDYENLMDFTGEVLKRYPEIDPRWLGVTGGSYGGVMTNWIVGHTHRFAAAVSQRSIANWITYEHSSDIGHTFTPDDLGTVTREKPELLWEQSPLKYAPNCRTPILFIHSDEDYRCYMAEGIAMYSAVKRNGCPARMCLFHGENHELSRSGKPENRIDRMREILDWMDAYLK